MAHIVSSMNLFDSLCESLNIEDKHMTSITIELGVNSPVKITIERLMDSDDSGRFTKVLNKYHLVKDAISIPTIKQIRYKQDKKR